MHTIGFQEAVKAVVEKDKRYHADAYVFLRDALEATLKRKKKARKEMGGHVSAAELLDGFRLHVLDEFGAMGMTVLDYWGIRHCEDVGHIVFNLIEAGAFGKTDEDTIESFRGGVDFHEAFVRPFLPPKNYLNAPAFDEVGRGE